MTAPGKKNRSAGLELLRLAAILLVIYNHTGTDGFMLFTRMPAGSVSGALYTAVSVCCTAGVPVFLAVSGALMLGRPQEPLSVILKKRVWRVLLPLLFWSVFYYTAACLRYGGTFSPAELLKGLYTSGIKGHLWYLYAYIAYLLCLPMLRPMAQGMEDRHFLWMLGGAVLLNGVVPCAEYLLFRGEVTLYSGLKPALMTANIVLYPCLGYYVWHRLTLKRPGRTIALLWAANVLCIAVSAGMVWFKGSVVGSMNESNTQTFLSPFAAVNCFTLLVTARALEARLPERGIVCGLGSCTFGLYLTHMFIRELTPVYYLPSHLTAAGLNPMLACWIDIAIIAAAGLAATWLLKKVPGIRRLVS